MNGLTKEEKSKALQYLMNGADFMLIPTTELCEKIINQAPESIGLNETLAILLLSRKPLRLGKDLVEKYCNGTLDLKNSWIFDNSNIEVVPHQFCNC